MGERAGKVDYDLENERSVFLLAIVGLLDIDTEGGKTWDLPPKKPVVPKTKKLEKPKSLSFMCFGMLSHALMIKEKKNCYDYYQIG